MTRKEWHERAAKLLKALEQAERLTWREREALALLRAS